MHIRYALHGADSFCDTVVVLSFSKKGAQMKLLHPVFFILTVVGALNWGLVGLLNINLVTLLFGRLPVMEQIVYVLVGLSAVGLLLSHKNDCKACAELMKK